MKLFITSLIIVVLLVTGIYPQTSYRFNINNINLPINNSGVLGDVNISPGGAGGKYNNIVFLFSGGFYLSGYTGNTLWANGVSSSSLVRDYQPGIVGSDPNLPQNKIYVVSADDPPFGELWQNWSNAVALGADFYDGDGDGIYNPVYLNINGIWDPNEDKPDILGDITAWCVYNDGVPASLRRWQSEPKGIEIQQTVFAYKDSHPLFSNTQNTIFVRYRIFNKGTVSQKLDSVFFSYYDDYDIGDYSDDHTGCDTLLYGGFVYNDGTEQLYGTNPPAAFTHFNQFPHIFIPGETFIYNNSNGIYDEGIDTPLDTAYNNNGPLRGIETYPGARNQKLTSFVHYQASDPTLGDPNTMQDARNYMTGKKRMGGYVDPCTWTFGQVRGGVNCSEVNPLYWYSGDPESNIGWINTRPTDQRMMVNTGHFTLLENEPVTIIIGYTIGHGTDAKNSVTKGKLFSQYASEFYQSNFENTLVSVDDDKLMLPDDFKLFQNYPNPFNPSTKISWQSPVGSWQTIKVFDVLGREVATLVDEYRDAGYYEVEFQSSIGSLKPAYRPGRLASGVYYYKLKAGNYIETKKMMVLR